MASPSLLQAQHDLLDAAKIFNWQRVFYALEEQPGLINCQPCHRFTTLHQASFCGDALVVNELLILRANPCITASAANVRPIDVVGGASTCGPTTQRHIKYLLQNAMRDVYPAASLDIEIGTLPPLPVALMGAANVVQSPDEMLPDIITEEMQALIDFPLLLDNA